MIETVEIRLQLPGHAACECLGRELGQREQVWEEVKAFTFRGTPQVLQHHGQESLEPVEGISLFDESVNGVRVALLQDIGEEFV